MASEDVVRIRLDGVEVDAWLEARCTFRRRERSPMQGTRSSERSCKIMSSGHLCLYLTWLVGRVSGLGSRDTCESRAREFPKEQVIFLGIRCTHSRTTQLSKCNNFPWTSHPQLQLASASHLIALATAASRDDHNKPMLSVWIPHAERSTSPIIPSITTTTHHHHHHHLSPPPSDTIVKNDI